MITRILLAAAVAALDVTAVVAQSDPIAARKALMKENGNQARIARIGTSGFLAPGIVAATTIFSNLGHSGLEAVEILHLV